MTAEMILLLVLLLFALALFVGEWLPVDVVTLLLLTTLILTGILTPSAAFSGFANEIIIILSSVFIISGAVVKTGIMSRLAGHMKNVPVSGDSPVIGAVMSFTASVSAFFSNTSATAILMPAAMEYSRGAGPGSGRILMPLAYASILGGSCTLIGTSTNMAASGLLRRVGMDGFALFEFTAIGLLIAVAGILWISLVGYRSLPTRADRPLTEDYSVQSYLSEFVVPEGSPLIDKSVRDSGLLQREIEPLALIRGGRRLPPHPLRKIRQGDVLIVLVTRQGVMSVKERGDLAIEADDSKLGASASLMFRRTGGCSTRQRRHGTSCSRRPSSRPSRAWPAVRCDSSLSERASAFPCSPSTGEGDRIRPVSATWYCDRATCFCYRGTRNSSSSWKAIRICGGSRRWAPAPRGRGEDS